MKYPLMVPTPFDIFRAHVYRFMRRPYATAAIGGYGFIILLASMYLSMPATYKSDMDLVLPGTGASSNVSLDDIGSVVSQTATPFSGGGFNPRVNYKEMLSSRGVLKRAAKTMNMSVVEFGKPKVKLTEQTSIISVTITGKSALHAQEKAWALYHGFQEELDHLRSDEVERRDESIKNVLEQYRERMNAAQNNIVDFQQRSFLVSSEQMVEAVGMKSRLEEKRMMAEAELREMDDYINQMSISLGVSPQLASKALALHSDPEFRSYMGELDASTALLTEYSSRWGNLHPKVINERKRQELARVSLQSRGEAVAGIFTHDLFNSLSLDQNPKRAQMFADLVEANARKKGAIALLDDVERSLEKMAHELRIYSREVAELSRLEREFNMAEAVFTSAAARLEANKADVFASYPVIQMLTTPSLVLQKVNPKTAIAVGGSIAGIIFISFGLIVVWQRKFIAERLLKRS